MKDWFKFIKKHIILLTVIGLALFTLTIIIAKIQAKEYLAVHDCDNLSFGYFAPSIRVKNGVISYDYISIVVNFIICFAISFEGIYWWFFYFKMLFFGIKNNVEDKADINSEYNTSFNDNEDSLENNYYED